METELKKILKEYNLKVTKVRLKVLQLLLTRGVAMSHTQISEELNDSSIDKVTLYRTLNSFTKAGIAHKVANEERNWLYAVYADSSHKQTHNHDQDHAHFVCDACDKIYCFPLEDSLIKLNYNKAGFQVTSKELRLHGTCPICQ